MNKQQLKFVCELIWGGMPTDKNFVENSSLFRTESVRLLVQYPQLDKSFFEQHAGAINIK